MNILYFYQYRDSYLEKLLIHSTRYIHVVVHRFVMFFFGRECCMTGLKVGFVLCSFVFLRQISLSLPMLKWSINKVNILYCKGEILLYGVNRKHYGELLYLIFTKFRIRSLLIYYYAAMVWKSMIKIKASCKSLLKHFVESQMNHGWRI